MSEPIAPLPGETARQFAARSAYLLLGAGRSLEKLRGQSGGRSGVPARLSTLEAQSTRFGWVAAARAYDAALAHRAAAAHAAAYLAELGAHQARYGRAGDALYRLAMQQLSAVQTTLRQGDLKLTPTTLGIVAKALQVAADLEAHALRIDVLLAECRQ